MAIIQEENYDYLYKVVMTGDSGVGKSSLISRFTRNEFDEESKTTIGVEFSTKNIKIGDKVIRAQVWDTAGQERYRAITCAYYRGAVGALITYDITNLTSFNKVGRWLDELKSLASVDIVVMLIGNKTDLEHLRAVTVEEGQEFADQNNMLFIETSALDSMHVEKAFNRTINRIHENEQRKQVSAYLVKEDKLQLTATDVKNGPFNVGCC